jgi:uncharacterized protein YydD (DUF2326 family)
MFLKSLIIHNDGSIIREILFHKGINLIVDETTSSRKTATGNSVGKTTVLRLIDFCLDGKGENIYKDPEFKNTNSKIENFLTNNNIIIQLTLTENLNNSSSNEIVIERNFLKYSSKIQRINGEKYDNKSFSQMLKQLIFKSSSKIPTFKQLKSKNIRDEKNKLVKTIRVLPQNVITDVTYEALHLFWFGINVDADKDQLVRERNLEIKLQDRLKKDSNLSQINQSLIIVDKQINELNKLKDSFNLNETYQQDLDQLNVIKQNMNKSSTIVSRLELRRELILESKEDLEKNIAEIDIEQIRRLYEKANSIIPDLQKSFEDTVSFHNEMIQNKIEFITSELQDVENTLQTEKRGLSELALREAQLSDKLNKEGAIEDLQKIIDDLNRFFERKGAFEEQKSMWENSIIKLRNIEEKLNIINAEIYSKDELIQKRISQFNEYFSDISSRLDGVYSLLSADSSEGVYKFKIGNIEGNPGTGSKKSQMASFDLAYIQFADALDIPALHFILQDQIENVHSNQITNLLTEIVSEVNCQYVLPVLRDKLPVNIDIGAFEVLSLSQENKLFKVE